jgi:hypothetical protein
MKEIDMGEYQIGIVTGLIIGGVVHYIVEFIWSWWKI